MSLKATDEISRNLVALRVLIYHLILIGTCNHNHVIKYLSILTSVYIDVSNYTNAWHFNQLQFLILFGTMAARIWQERALRNQGEIGGVGETSVIVHVVWEMDI